jgi:hypothetical protein
MLDLQTTTKLYSRSAHSTLISSKTSKVLHLIFQNSDVVVVSLFQLLISAEG